ncbi:MAG: DUF805 domain-containing protein [Candidatus Dadabacteria bacterium]|nr:DUF805 domain-containing protein [Candidatus Dadabacteria bacterium]NIS07969.1 DUF805 domain-containing protein [Candidatus Dadabacteria bacterium]NIV43090.1 DUF805 domain-containing protein [Candidatus Dadabacteria bacterium]NIX14926.1 DUF805 domain-containing protein [Candidatus Dadabacteria bacterium]NIY21553.1 DUF805 domain-containing protein [Candidatus Dadabacteria bacterium]
MSWYLAALKKYGVFDGRSRRKEYWFFALFNFIISSVLTAIESTLGFVAGGQGVGILSGLYALAVLIPGLAVTIRRLHDTGHSGWWIFINLIPLIGFLVFLYYMVKDSDPGQNEYGPNPKGETAQVSGTAA